MSRQTEETPPRRRRRGRKRLAALVLLVAGLFWLNGPGWRWIGSLALRHVFANAGMTADFQLTGTLWSGIGVEGLKLSGGKIRKLELGSAGAKYDIARVIRGELRGVKIEHVDVVIDLAVETPPKEPSEPFDPAKLAATLKKVRALVLPLDLSAADLRFQLVRGPETLVELGTSDFSHTPGSEDFRLKLGTLAAGAGYSFEPQETVIRWGEESFGLDRFQATPRLGVRDVRADLPASGKLSGGAVIRIEDSELALEATPSAATLKFSGPPLKIEEAVKNFAIELPATASVRALTAEIEGLDARTPDLWKAKLHAEIADARYQDWQAESLVLDATKTGPQAQATWSLTALGDTATGDAEVRWRNLAAGHSEWAGLDATGKLRLPHLESVYGRLREQLAFAPADAPPLPASALTLDWTYANLTTGPGPAQARFLISPTTPAPAEGEAAAAATPTSLAGEAAWDPAGKVTGTLGADGLRAHYQLDLKAKTYEAGATLEDFTPDRLAAWLAAAHVKVPAGMTAALEWKGDGALGPQPHRGEFAIGSFHWTRPDPAPAIDAKGSGRYAWPESVDLSRLEVVSQGQTIAAEARFADRLLKLTRLEWKEGETRLFGGQAEIPVPEKIASARDFLQQTTPLNVFLESEWIDFARLAVWLPEKKPLPAEGSGRVHLVITGTPAAPKIDFETALKGVRVPGQPDVPVTDAIVNVDATGETLTLRGELKPAGYPPVTLSGKLPFKPGAWAEDPELLKGEKLEARANIPRLELATFKRFVPQATQLAGTLEGFFSAGGTLGQPDLAGELKLAGGAFAMDDSKVPPVTNAAATIRLAGKEVRLDALSLESAGGTLRGSGKVGLADTANPALELSLRGVALPLMRDDSMIIRSDAALDLRGTLKQAAITGTVDVVDSLFYRDFEILPLRVPFTAPSRPKLPSFNHSEKGAGMPEPFRNWTLDVRVRTRDPLLVRGNLAAGSATADIRFGGTLSAIQPQGAAVLRDITARLPFSTLKVAYGTATFTPAGGLNPELNIRGTSTIGQYEVNVFFYGPVNAPKTALTADPPLPESEIMTLLATGTTSDGLENGQAATMKAVQLLVEEWRKGRLPFGEQVAKVMTVLNRVDLRVGEDDPLSGKRLNSATIELNDRFYISGAVDKESNTRVLGAFVLKFK